MNNVRKISILAAAMGLAVAASAQTTPIAHPFKVELGAWFPTFSISGVSKDTGVTYALGYTFFQKPMSMGNLQVEGELRGNTFKISGGGDDATVTFGQLLVNANLTTADAKLFYGIHLGLGKGKAKIGGVTFSDDDTRFVYGGQVGYNFNPNVYGVVRYSTTNEELYRGFSVGVGYRF